MAERAHLQSVTIADKNGRYTTVYRRLNKFGQAIDMSAVPPASNSKSEIQLAPSVAAMIDKTATLGQNRSTVRKGLIPVAAGENERKHKTKRIKEFDPITVAVIASSIREQSITRDRLAYIEGMTNDEAREYVTVVSTVGDLETNAIFTYALFNGMRPVSDDDTYLRMDLSTDDRVAECSAVMRFGMQFVTLNMHSGKDSAVDFGDVFTTRTTDGQTGQTINPDLCDLVSRRPQDIDAICGLMQRYPVAHAAAIEEMLDHGSTPVSEGVL